MDILFVATEIAPYEKVGGLADVVAALPKALRGLGHKVTVVLPKTPRFDDAGLLLARRLTPLTFSFGGSDHSVTLYDVRLSSHVELILVESAGLFSRTGVYGERGEDYADNAERFAVLSRAAAEIARSKQEGGQGFDVVHAHDWPTALVPTYLSQLGVKAKCVLTIHNLAHQGIFPKDVLPKLGLAWEAFHVDGIEFYGKLNLLKQGIVSAAAITTVSPTYAREIQDAKTGERLDGILRARETGVTGILNGVDYAVWNPASDSELAARYDAEDTTNKMRCKGALQRELGLPLEPETPVVAYVGRLAAQKGPDLIAHALPELLRGTDAQFVIVGDGDPALKSQLDAACAKSGGRAIATGHVKDAVVHRVFAGADVVIVPSRFEPCGLVQMYAQRYGAAPVVRKTGGLADTVVDCDAKLETGTGFVFEDDDAGELIGAVERALAARALPTWPRLIRRIMRLDRSWDRAARQYEQLYKNLASA
jgi:starch synthase